MTPALTAGPLKKNVTVGTYHIFLEGVYGHICFALGGASGPRHHVARPEVVTIWTYFLNILCATHGQYVDSFIWPKNYVV